MGRRLSCPRWGYEATRQLYLQKCRVEGRGGRSWKEQMELRLEEMYVKLTEHLIFINVFEVLHKPWRRNSKSYSSCKVLLFRL